ncbi:MAG: GTPase ObgE/CgtA [Phycisphaerales bacterium]|nr:GTPase ObgE/CgtA [Phycisphaerales bacterium]
MFVDRAIITVRAGKGGDGCVAFRREKGEPKGGPNGGDGGKGADVVLVAEDGMHTLYDFRGVPALEAKDGDPGGGKQCHGADAPDLIVKLPPGTLVYNDQTGELMTDLKPADRVVIAKGGKGGWGNEHFKSSTNQTPRRATPGAPGESFRLRFELKLIADVGFVGLPNAGKSTLLAALTRATPKIADYPFTTLSPQLGISELDAMRRIVMADIPGLIEGAAQGAGLGLDFLRHIERTRVLVHLLDAQPPDGTTPAQNYRTVRHELTQYSEALASKPELIVLNKIDLLMPEEVEVAVKSLARELDVDPRVGVLAISGAANTNLRPLLDKLWAMLHPAGGGVEHWKQTARA